MSELLKAWYTLLILAVLSVLLLLFSVTLPFRVSSWLSLPHQLLQQAGKNLQEIAQRNAERRDFQTEISDLQGDVVRLREEKRQLELQLDSFRQAMNIRVFQSPGIVTTASVTEASSLDAIAACQARACQSARVRGSSASTLHANLTLGAGQRDGVVLYMPVTVPEGLVGLVTEVDATSALVRTVLDPSSRVGITIRNKGGQGIAVGELGNLIRVVEFYADDAVAVGDLVETQSRGGLFPRGILLGEVVEVLPHDPNSLYQEFLLRPAVDMYKVLEVALIAPL